MNKLKKKYMISHSLPDISEAEKVKILKTFSIFKDATEEKEILDFAKKVRQTLIPPMEIFVEEDRDENQAFFVYKGAVSIFRTTSEGEIINIDILGAPELVGEMGIVDSKPSPANVMAIEETHALVLSKKDFEDLIRKHPNTALRFIKVFADRIRHFDIFLEELLSKNLYERTWHILQYVSQYFPDNEIALSQEELADLFWGTRSRVTEVLNKLQDEGKIKIGRRKVKLL
ncbi:MAG: hypothetical protein A3C30_04530 [Candidatus Levybacteria bacterium RIFCSPHIGHO2_02_FULL_40_18]|nr:MAG: hypothetical protein A2869_02185 [Candidatus Levybacteria bacterium RIFCSPHIGHO2_01_FULL_40_58]OGH26346.1 MAG: hypothetical protein A3C30_04530 [Candidatus Levybacteria bacterium RIFCSPHIGHO2_02_FULL_40_18]OGH31793.1 MAG: hypothetical protein A3E43_00325 [Candidatus Levybacteria bacterium RIFCSPHIGHO2_12_FULL_40_31]OGH40426.1 MAG: hypothetical protein A2894_00830 [Candidatus Levybacteria bacterium RIFCSPLOWO2_01_FULL_40_64]OGH49136.1 MAG: hypothetical protein A3I54_04225 [Candidatus Lev